MRIGIDARLVTYRRGMGNFVYHLLAELAALPTRHTFILYADSPAAAAAVPAHPRFQLRVLRPALYPLWEQVVLPLQAARDRVRVLHCPANTAPLWRPRRARLVVTIHDVMYLLPDSVLPSSPSRYQRLGRRYRAAVVPSIARRATAISTVSDYSRGEILAHLAVPPERVHTVYEAPGPAFHRLPDGAAAATCARLGLPGPFIVGLGAVDPRKNTLRLLEAFAAARPDLPPGSQLALVGLPAGAQAEFSAVVDRLDLGGAVRLLGFVSEAELVALYNRATVMAYPSLYEGFGLPVLEAMACGAPVISSNVTSIPEVARDAALLIDPCDARALAQALIAVATDPARQADLRRRGLARAGQFSWAATARAMLALYETAGRA